MDIREQDPVALIEQTDWASLEHAYAAAQDTPLQLVRLLDEDPEVQADALAQLDISVLSFAKRRSARSSRC